LAEAGLNEIHYSAHKSDPAYVENPLIKEYIGVYGMPDYSITAFERRR